MKRKSGPRRFSAFVEDLAFARSGGKCEKCGGLLKPGQFEYDHIKPKALGGTNDLANCQVLCASCHIAKSQDIDNPQTREADRSGKVKRGLIVAEGLTAMQRRYGDKL